MRADANEDVESPHFISVVTSTVLQVTNEMECGDSTSSLAGDKRYFLSASKTGLGPISAAVAFSSQAMLHSVSVILTVTGNLSA